MKLPLAKLQAAVVLTSTDKTRYWLDGVYFKLEKGIVTLAATDGHALIKFEIDGIDNSRFKDVDFIIPSFLIKKIKKARYVDDVEINIKGDQISIDYDDDTFRSPAIDGTFPDYEHVIPDIKKYDNGSGCNSIGINPKFFAKFARINKILGFPKAGVRMRLHSKEEPAIITLGSNESEYTGVLMPMRYW